MQRLKPWSDCSREEKLFILRSAAEGAHRHEICLRGVKSMHKPSTLDPTNNPPNMTTNDFRDTCNKSVPLYIIQATRFTLLSIVLHNYIYRRWFRPYRSEIEHERFICKFIALYDPASCCLDFSSLATTFNTIRSLNNSICTRVESLRSWYDETIASSPKSFMDRVGIVHDHRRYVLQPLFRALVVVVHGKDYAEQDSASVGNMSVLLVRTGIEDGLGAPITFESIRDKIETSDEGSPPTIIKTKLETAIDFVISLEAREADAFGLQPDPVCSTLDQASYVSLWESGFGKEDPVIAPSSRFVSEENALKWGWRGNMCWLNGRKDWENGRKD